jgi:hypothetical protein
MLPFQRPFNLQIKERLISIWMKKQAAFMFPSHITYSRNEPSEEKKG